MTSLSLLYLLIALSFNATGNILLKMGAQSGVIYNPATWAGLICFGLNVVFYFMALRQIPISIAYPAMVIMSFIIINGVAYWVLSESITGMQLIGYCLMVVGLFFVFKFHA